MITRTKTASFANIWLFPLVILSVLAGCAGSTTYSGIEPIYPTRGNFRRAAPVDVDSIRPNFEWKVEAPGQKVDLGIWESSSNIWSGREMGRRVYFKEGIEGGKHLIEKDLEPDKVYYWSIKGTGTTKWSTANYDWGFSPNGLPSRSYGNYFLIKTPKVTIK
jgi:hypothetical protein